MPFLHDKYEHCNGMGCPREDGGQTERMASPQTHSKVKNHILIELGLQSVATTFKKQPYGLIPLNVTVLC